MKKLIPFILAAVMVLITFAPLSADADDVVTINVYNWGQYISDGSDGYPDVIADFEKAYPNIKVNYMTFESNESMYTKLQAGGSAFDIVVPSDYMVEKMIAEDMLAPLDFENIPNYKYIDESLKNMAYDPDNTYSVPYTWGYTGLIYNSKYVNEEDVVGWELMWDPTYAGKILMFDNPRDAYALAEYILGYSANTEDPEELQAATELLKEQKNLVQAYVMDQIFDKLERGEAWIGAYYAGDYLLMVDENPDLEFLVPEEGYNLFVDAICILKDSQHKKEAETFINFLCDPEVMGPNLEYLGYAAPASAAKEYMDPELAESDIAYPSEEVLARGEAYKSLSLEGTQLMNELWLSVKTTDDVLSSYLWLTGGAIVVVAALIIFFSVRKKRRIARRGTYAAGK